jgi:hypothetical protein
MIWKPLCPPILAALALVSATNASAAPAGDPATARYVYFGLTNDAGAPAAAYVSVPVAPSHGGQADAWMVYVFKTALATPKGAGAYTVTLQTYDCDHLAVSTRSGDLYDASARSLDHFVANTPFGPKLPPGSVGALAAGLVCDGPVTGALAGLPAVIADAAQRAKP